MTNEVLLAIPLFIFMGVMLERSRIAEDLLETMGRLFGALPGGLGISVCSSACCWRPPRAWSARPSSPWALIVLPTMLRLGYDQRLAAGTVAATATLAQIFPPATVLVLLGDQLANAYQAAQLRKGIFAPESVTVGDLFAGAPGSGLRWSRSICSISWPSRSLRPAAVAADAADPAARPAWRWRGS